MANEQNVLIGFNHLNEHNVAKFLEVEETLKIPIELGKSKVHGLFTDQEHHKHHDHNGQVRYDVKTKVLVALETKDQQIDFNIIKLHSNHGHDAHHHGHGHGGPHTYELVQLREIIPRKKYQSGSDPIVQFKAVFTAHGPHHSELVAVVRRRSGAFDLYYSGQKVFTSKASKIE